MEKKSLYGEDEFYSPEALDLLHEVKQAITPIFDKYIKNGYGIREIAQVISSSIVDLECSRIMGVRSKKIREKRLDKEKCSKQ